MLESLGLIGLFAVGTFWFWVLLVASSGFLFWSLEGDRGFGATVTLLATIFLLQTMGDIRVLDYLKGDPWKIGYYVFGYFLLGVVWSFGKWFFFLIKLREKYYEVRDDLLKRNNVAIANGDAIPSNLRNAWKACWLEFVRRSDYGFYTKIMAEEDLIPKARNHQKRILVWMTYWPWSMVWTLICDVVKKIFTNLYRILQRWYQAIANYVFRGIERDSPPRNQSPPGGVTNQK